ncbi:hypothetical protein CB1_000194009 [Camelus ferus]|nr:hypothetical protein CB1_000194009 [Camelus ferus]
MASCHPTDCSESTMDPAPELPKGSFALGALRAFAYVCQTHIPVQTDFHGSYSCSFNYPFNSDFSQGAGNLQNEGKREHYL